jgi:hypothetical protein
LEYQFGVEAARRTTTKAPVLEYKLFSTLFSALPSIGQVYRTDGSIELEFNQPFRQILLSRGLQVEHPEGADYKEGFGRTCRNGDEAMLFARRFGI